MQVQTREKHARGRERPLAMGFARCTSDVTDAQRLRYRVFGEEMGARLASAASGIDRDMFDPHCEHLIVRDADTGETVGTYRMLNAAQARKIGGFYSENEFDITRLAQLRHRMVEVGRSCVHPDYRTGGTIALLWSGVAEYMRKHRYDYLIGCASVGMGDGGHMAASLYNALRMRHLAPVEYRSFPRCRLPIEALDQGVELTVPPLIKGYLRVGAWVCGEPAWDPDFNTADLFTLLPLERLNPRYARHFLKEHGFIAPAS